MSNIPPPKTGFNVRTYGLWAKDNRILISQEQYETVPLLKFPGGGVEVNEAPGEALIREFREEVGVSSRLGGFQYVSPHFHHSYFRPVQLVALYWSIVCDQEPPEEMLEQHFEGRFLKWQKLIWMPLDSFEPEKLSHAGDREVAEKFLLSLES